MSSKLDHALRHAAEGFRVFPLKAGAKHPPLITDWPSLATSDADQIRAWWADWPDANIGVATGGGLLVLDFDTKDGQRGADSLFMLEMLGLPETMRVRTPTGGVHVYVRVDPGQRWPNSVDSIPGYRHVDVRGDGGYVVGRGSTIGDGAYE